MQDCYDLPQYWDLAFDEDTGAEADFIQTAVRKYTGQPLKTALEPGCGGGRLVIELARRGVFVTGWDLSEPSVQFARQRLQAEQLSGDVQLADMMDAQTAQPVDAAFCMVNTFRHLLTEDAARRHLKNIAASLRPGGLYIIGLHLFPPDADEEDEETWTYSRDGVTVHMQLTVTECDRQLRLETLHFEMTVNDPNVGHVQTFESSWQMRLYSADQLLQLLSTVPEFELLDVFDFWYDLSEPLQLNDELGDTVLILGRRGR